jgi:hypothetical protein
MARYCSAIVRPLAEDVVVGVGVPEAAETNCMGFFHNPRPYAGCCTKGAVDTSLSSYRGSSS